MPKTVKRILWWLKQIALGFWCAPRDVIQWLSWLRHKCDPVEAFRTPHVALTTVYPESGEVFETPGFLVVFRCSECGEQTSNIVADKKGSERCPGP